MRKMVSIGVGVAGVAMVLGTAAGVASASSSHQVASFKPAVAQSVNKHITRAQAKAIAEAKVPNSKAIEVESDDLHDVPVWKVTLSVKNGRVIVDVNKRTGKATIVKHEKHGDDGKGGDHHGDHGDRDAQRAAGDERHGNDDRHGNDERHGHDQRGHDDRRGHDRHDRDDRRGHDENDG